MSLASDLPAPARSDRHSLGRRATAFVLAVATTFLIIFTLLTFNAPSRERPQFKGRPILLDLSPDAEPAPTVQPKRIAAKERPQQALPAPQAKPTPPTPPTPIPMPTKNPLPFLELTQEEFAAADISKLGTRGSAAAAGNQVASAAGDTETVGTAPNGEPLYRAEWYRRPTNAELSTYLPARMPAEGWGLVACKTAPRYFVEDCVELGSSPAGSRLAGAVRQAAWQFRVRPPRVGGKELIGSWVRILIDYGRSPED